MRPRSSSASLRSRRARGPRREGPSGASPLSNAKHSAKQIRGSTLLLTGTALSRLFNGAAQVLLARSLSKAEYGAFAFGIAVVALAEVIVSLGLNQAITRYVPVYEERGEHGKALGTLVLVFGTIISLGLTLVLIVRLFTGSLEDLLIHDRLTVSIFAILVALVPIDALNRMSDGVLAVLGRPGMIFVRKNVLAPGLRVLVVALLITRDASLRFLAFGYVMVGLVGIATYAGILPRALREHGFSVRSAWRQIEFPVREVTTYVVPLLISALAWSLIDAGDAIVLGRLRGAADVAELRAVQPLATLMQAILYSFTLLFTTLAARLFARGDRIGMNDMYWRTTTWIALLAFPLLAMELVFAPQVTTTLYGSRYADSASVLAILAVGYFLQGCLSLGGPVLAVFRRVRYILAVNLTVLGVAIVLMLALVPPLGARGAALAKVAAIVVGGVGLQAGLRRTGVRGLDPRFLPVYASLGAGLGALWLVQALVHPPLVVGLVLTAAVWIALVAGTRASLDIGNVFPELRRVPLARYLAADPDDT